jgi:hypothetical protein
MYVVITTAKPCLRATTLQLDKMEKGVRCYCKLLPTNMHLTAIYLLPFREFATNEFLFVVN